MPPPRRKKEPSLPSDKPKSRKPTGKKKPASKKPSSPTRGKAPPVATRKRWVTEMLCAMADADGSDNAQVRSAFKLLKEAAEIFTEACRTAEANRRDIGARIDLWLSWDSLDNRDPLKTDEGIISLCCEGFKNFERAKDFLTYSLKDEADLKDKLNPGPDNAYTEFRLALPDDEVKEYTAAESGGAVEKYSYRVRTLVAIEERESQTEVQHYTYKIRKTKSRKKNDSVSRHESFRLRRSERGNPTLLSLDKLYLHPTWGSPSLNNFKSVREWLRAVLPATEESIEALLPPKPKPDFPWPTGSTIPGRLAFRKAFPNFMGLFYGSIGDDECSEREKLLLTLLHAEGYRFVSTITGDED